MDVFTSLLDVSCLRTLPQASGLGQPPSEPALNSLTVRPCLGPLPWSLAGPPQFSWPFNHPVDIKRFPDYMQVCVSAWQGGIRLPNSSEPHHNVFHVECLTQQQPRLWQRICCQHPLALAHLNTSRPLCECRPPAAPSSLTPPPKVVSEPMDFGTMKDKAERGQYRDPQQVRTNAQRLVHPKEMGGTSMVRAVQLACDYQAVSPAYFYAQVSCRRTSNHSTPCLTHALCLPGVLRLHAGLQQQPAVQPPRQ